MHIETKSLPAALQTFLKNELEFHKADISLQGKETISPLGMGGQGRQEYFATFNLQTEETRVIRGSFGGANAFNPTNQVDLNGNDYAIPVGTIVIKGCVGSMNHASLYVNPSSLAPLLPSGPTVSARESALLRPFVVLKAFARKESLDRMSATPAEIEALITAGYLKRNKAGALSITTSGKNAAYANEVKTSLYY